MTWPLGMIALYLGLGSLFVCVLSLLVLGIVAPLGLLEINLSEEIEDFSTHIDETVMSLVALLGRAARYIALALQRTVQHAGRAIKEIAMLLLTIITWPVRYTYRTVMTLLFPPAPNATDLFLYRTIDDLERRIKSLVARGHREYQLIKESDMLQRDLLMAQRQARNAERGRNQAVARMNDQHETISTLQQQVASFPQEYLQLKEKNARFDALEQKLRDARNGAEERRVKAVEKATTMVTNAQHEQQLAEVERDQAESYFKRAERKFEDRLKTAGSEIFNLKKEIAKKSWFDPRINADLAKQARDLHGERDDAREALDSVTAQLEATKAAEAAAQSLVQTIRAELQSVHGPDGIEGDLYLAQVELAQCKADARRKVKAAGNRCRHYKTESEADRAELQKVQRSLEATEREHRREIFNLGQQHQGSMWTAQGEIRNLEDSRAHLWAELERVEREAQLPRDPESQASLSLAAAELQRVRDEHISELQRVRDEHASDLQAVHNTHGIELQQAKEHHASELQNREAELIRQAEEAYAKRSAEWSGEAEASARQVGHWRSRAEESAQQLHHWRSRAEESAQQLDNWRSTAKAAEESVEALNQTAERVAREQGQRENELNAKLQQFEAEAAQRENAHEARLKEYQARVDELQTEVTRARDDLGDLQARVSQGSQQMVAEGPAASIQVPQTLPTPQIELNMSQEEMDAWLNGFDPVTLESLGNFESFDQPQAPDSAAPLQTLPSSPPSPTMSTTIDDWLARYPDLDVDSLLQQPPAADSAAPLQTSPTSPPPEPPLEYEEPEMNLATELDPDPVPTSAPAQEPGPLAAPQHALAPIFTPPSLPMGMTPRGPRKAKSRPNHYTQERREEEAAYDAGLGEKLDWMFGRGPMPSTPQAPTQSVPLGIPGSSGFDFSWPLPGPSAEPHAEARNDEEEL